MHFEFHNICAACLCDAVLFCTILVPSVHVLQFEFHPNYRFLVDSVGFAHVYCCLMMKSVCIAHSWCWVLKWCNVFAQLFGASWYDIIINAIIYCCRLMRFQFYCNFLLLAVVMIQFYCTNSCFSCCNEFLLHTFSAVCWSDAEFIAQF